MRTDDLLLRVECYVAVRKALGYAVRSEEKLLKDFIQFLELNRASSPIRAQTAIEWACAPAPGRGPSGEASRLKVVRRFLSHLQAFEFETEVPGPGVLPAFRRPLPYLYSSEEIAALMKEASHLGPKDSLRPYTYVALIGLLASSGLRVGEALRLKVEEVRLSCSHPHPQVVQTKFRKSRLVPLHPSSADKIARYAAQRKRRGYDALSDAFFVSEKGDHLSYRACRNTFSGLAYRAGICKRPGIGRPGIHSLRHVFAVGTSVMAVAEANYGRMDESLRYVTFIASELDTEQPGALPELFDSPDYMYFQAFTSRAMVMQACFKAFRPRAYLPISYPASCGCFTGMFRYNLTKIAPSQR